MSIRDKIYEVTKKNVNKLDLNQRYEAILHYETQPERLKKDKIAELAKMFNCSGTQIYELIKIKDEFKAKYEQIKTQFGRVEGYTLPMDYTPATNEKLFRKVYEWYQENVHNEYSVISGPILRSKANELAKELRMQDFVATYSWIRGFAKRYKISFRALKDCGPATQTHDVMPRRGRSATVSASDVRLTSYTEAIEYLKKLEDFALIKEDFRLIGLLDRLSENFKEYSSSVVDEPLL